MDSKQDYINYESLRKYVDITDSELFTFYLKEIYKDLSERFDSNKKQGVSKLAFYDYLKLPVFIAEKIFSAIDNDDDGYLNIDEFTKGLARIYDGTFEETALMIFKIYDFDKDKKITPGDVKVLLSYLPLKTDEINKEYKYQMESLEEIEEIVKLTFGNKKHLNQTDYLKILENTKTDIYLQLLFFIYQKKPFSNENITICRKSSKSKSIKQEKVDITPESPDVKAKKYNKLLLSPKKNSIFSPADSLIKLNLIDNSDPQDENKVNELVSGFKGVLRMPNSFKKESKTDVQNWEKIVDSPTKFLGKKEPKETGGDFNLDDNMISMNDEDETKTPDSSTLPRSKDSNKEKYVLHEDWIFKLGDNNTKLKKYWLVLIGKDIYYYTDETKSNLEGMHSLSSCFLKENKETIVLGQKVFPFSLTFQPKSRTYYCVDKESYKSWTANLSKAIGYLNFFDFYEIIDEIGVGKFGMVKLGVHKNTKKRVAIKIMKKSDMNNSDIELVKGELDIMMLCAHPNIVKLLDYFENLDFIFIVMEHLSGGDLGTFLEKKKGKISESLMSVIMFQIASGLEYLHRYGVVHRDLKPENIMLASKQENPIVIKIMDFGLSKIMGPNEKAADGYGTLTYVAPEVLVRQPYNKQIDIWSLGVIMFYGLTLQLPFDDPSDNEEVIAKMIVFSPLDFKKNLWSNKSKEVMDLIKLCLQKKAEERIDIKGFLEHSWIKQYNMK